MSLSRIFEISSTAISAQSQRLNVVSSNLANAETMAGPDGVAVQGPPRCVSGQGPRSDCGCSCQSGL